MKQSSLELAARRGAPQIRVKDDDSLLSERHKLLMSKGSIQSNSRSPPQLHRQKGGAPGAKARFDSPFIGLSDLGNTYYPNIVNVQQSRTYQRSSQASKVNNHTLSIFPQTSASKLRTNQHSERENKPYANQQAPRQGQIQQDGAAGKLRHASDQNSFEESPRAEPGSAVIVTEIDTPELGGPLVHNNKAPTVVSRVPNKEGKSSTDNQYTT